MKTNVTILVLLINEIIISNDYVVKFNATTLPLTQQQYYSILTTFS